MRNKDPRASAERGFGMRGSHVARDGRGEGFPRARRFSSDDLQLMMLALLAEKPGHGYELIRALDMRSNGFYVPSPGMVYPALAGLEEAGQVSVGVEGNRKRYAITAAGRAQLEQHAARAQEMFAKLAQIACKMDSVRRAFAGNIAGEEGTAHAPSQEAVDAVWVPELAEARRALRRALILRVEAPVEEQRRVAAILAHAALEIEGDGLVAGNPRHPTGDSRMNQPNAADLAVVRLRHPLKRRLLQVVRAEAITPYLKRVTLAGDDLEDFTSASFDDHVKLFLPEPGATHPVLPEGGPGTPPRPGEPRPTMRDYTPRRFDREARELVVDFVLHDVGPASDWAAQAAPGQYLGVGGPRGSFVIPNGFDWYWLIGDETALPAIGRRLEELPAGARAIVTIEARDPSARIELESEANVQQTWCYASEQGANALYDAVAATALPAGEGYVWAAGESASMRAIRQHLTQSLGIDKSRIRASSYWKRGETAVHEHLDD